MCRSKCLPKSKVFSSPLFCIIIIVTENRATAVDMDPFSLFPVPPDTFPSQHALLIGPYSYAPSCWNPLLPTTLCLHHHPLLSIITPFSMCIFFFLFSTWCVVFFFIWIYTLQAFLIALWGPSSSYSSFSRSLSPSSFSILFSSNYFLEPSSNCFSD